MVYICYKIRLTYAAGAIEKPVEMLAATLGLVILPQQAHGTAVTWAIIFTWVGSCGLFTMYIIHQPNNVFLINGCPILMCLAMNDYLPSKELWIKLSSLISCIKLALVDCICSACLISYFSQVFSRVLKEVKVTWRLSHWMKDEQVKWLRDSPLYDLWIGTIPLVCLVQEKLHSDGQEWLDIWTFKRLSHNVSSLNKRPMGLDALLIW